MNPDARAAYADHDPVVMAHVRALLADGEGIAAVTADLTRPAEVLASPDLRAVIDPAAPACIVLGLVLSLMGARRAREAVAGYARLAAPGSLAVISCLCFADEALWEQVRGAFTAGLLRNHAPGQVWGFFAGLEAVPPGLVAMLGS